MRYVKILVIILLLVSMGFGSSYGSSVLAATLFNERSVQTTPAVENHSFSTRLHPQSPLYVGDQVSFEIFSAENTSLTTEEVNKVQVQIDAEEDILLGPVDFSWDANKGQLRAVLQWVWNTSGLDPGTYTLSFTTAPVEITWSQVVTLADPARLPPAEREAVWASTQTECCTLHYITGTDAERDLEMLRQILDEEAAQVSALFNTELQENATITLLPRVLGHGGFAGEELYISYLDRNYAGDGARQVIRHEIVHMIDGQLGGEHRPSIFVEGLAVYLSGGHFKPEPVPTRARALLDLGWYLPLSELANDFYASQHEIGYLEGAVLVDYMIQTWGFEAFSAFYRDIEAPKDRTEAAVIDAALQEHFGLAFAQLEEQLLLYLNEIPPDENQQDDLRLTVHFFDTVRRYQRMLDPAAYFRQVWLPDGNQMRERGIVADYLRHPNRPENRTLELLLVAADQELRLGNYPEVEDYLLQVNETLDHYSSISAYAWIFQLRQMSLLNHFQHNPIMR